MNAWQIGAILFTVLTVTLGAVTWLGEWWSRRDALRRMVWRNLEAAYQNGQFDLGGYSAGESAQQIAYDMALYACGCEDVPPWKLEPHVRVWMLQKGLRP